MRRLMLVIEHLQWLWSAKEEHRTDWAAMLNQIAFSKDSPGRALNVHPLSGGAFADRPS